MTNLALPQEQKECVCVCCLPSARVTALSLRLSVAAPDLCDHLTRGLNLAAVSNSSEPLHMGKMRRENYWKNLLSD